MKSHFLKPVLPVLVLPFLALGAHAQEATGYSHPDQTTAAPSATDHYVKPSHSDQAVSAPAYQDSFPATATETGAAAVEKSATDSKLLPRDAASQPSGAKAAPALNSSSYAPNTPPAPIERAALAPAATEQSHDGDIVLEVPAKPHEVTQGTVLHTRLRESLATDTTPEGSVFTAELLSDVARHGEVMLPAGSLIRGRVTSVHGGKRISGGASMHLQPETISLPDGTLYRFAGQVSDLNSTQDLRVNDEGTIVLRSNPKAAAAVVGGVTATAAVTGAVVGGGVGAAVGAIAGAGAATAVYLKREVQERVPAGTDIFFALDQPLTTTPH